MLFTRIMILNEKKKKKNVISVRILVLENIMSLLKISQSLCYRQNALMVSKMVPRRVKYVLTRWLLYGSTI